MSKTVSLWGATYSNVPAIEVPSGNTTAKFIEPSPTTATASDVAQGKIFFDSQGNQQTGSASGGGNEFLVTFTKSGNSWVPDKTFSQTFTAYTNGKTICSLASNNSSTSIVYDDDNDGFYVLIEEGFDDFNGSQYYNWGVYVYAYIWTSEGFDEDENSTYYATDKGTALPSDVASGKVFYNTTGIQIGTASGGSVPYPTFDVTWSNDWSDILSVTCDKTYQYCYDLYNNDADSRAVTIEHDQANTETYYLGASSYMVHGNTDVKYVVSAGGIPTYDISYHQNGTISFNYPSSKIIDVTPTASKGTVSNASVSVTPSVSVPSGGGFISVGTRTGTPVTVTASELVSGNLPINQNGNNIDVTNYQTVSVNVSGGSTFTLEYQNSNGLWSFTPTYADIKAAVQQNKVIDYTSFGDPALGGKYGSGYATNVTIGGVTFTEAVRFYLQDFTFGGVSLVHYGYSGGELRVQSNLEFFEPQGNLNITTNGTHDVTNYATVSVNVSGGTSKNVQVHQSTTRATSSTYTNVNSLTCTKSAKYTVYWSTMRSSTSGTSGSQLYIGGTAYGTADTTTWSNHVQNKKVTGVQINANQTVAVYARSRGTNYYAYAPLLTIIEE